MDPWVVSWLLKWGGARIPTFPGTAWNEGSYVELCWKNLAIQNQQVGSCKPCGYCYGYSRYRYPCKTVHRCIARYALPLWSSSMLICHSHIVYPSTDPQILNFPISWAKMQDFTTRIYQMRNIWIPLCYFYPTPKWCHLDNIQWLYTRWGCWLQLPESQPWPSPSSAQSPRATCWPGSASGRICNQGATGVLYPVVFQ